MKLKLFAFILLILASSPGQLQAKEELTVVQTVARDRRSFVVGKGIKDGVLKNQEAIFANENVSIVCKAIEVNRNFSMWVPIDSLITIPFKKEEIVSSNSAVYGNVALDVATDESLIPKESVNAEYRKLRLEDNFALMIGYNKALSQSTSAVAEDQTSTGVGFNFIVEYNSRFMPEFELNYGFRYDKDVYRVEDQQLDVPTTRLMGTLGATYHFVNFSEDNKNVYVSLVLGIGQSKTDVSGTVSSGIVTLLPEVRLGYIVPFTKTKALVFEAAIDSLSSTEEFSSGAEQTTNVVNLKGSIGLRF